jgi:hypothetical protein
VIKTESNCFFGGGCGCLWIALVLLWTVVLSEIAPPLHAADGSEQWWRSIENDNKESLVFITVTARYANDVVDQRAGTGFIVHPDGYVLTCYHVIYGDKAEHAGEKPAIDALGSVGGRDENSFPLDIICDDYQVDLILLKLRSERSWRSLTSLGDARFGLDIVALGFPGKQGIIPAVGFITASAEKGRLFTNAPLNHGVSGGPVFDKSGNLVGIAEEGLEELKGLDMILPISFAISPLLQKARSPLLTPPLSSKSIVMATATPTEIAQGRRVIELCDFLVDGPPEDKDGPLNFLTRKIHRLSERVLGDCSEDISKGQLSKELLNVGYLEVQKSDRFPGYKKMADFWHTNTSVLEIIEGNILTKKDPNEMSSDVHLFGLKGSLKEATITIPTEMTAANLASIEDLHCAVALYALAMDLKQRYASLTDNKEKQRYIPIIMRYLGKVGTYLPQTVANANQLQIGQEELAKELWEAAQKEAGWCKMEGGNQ